MRAALAAVLLAVGLSACNVVPDTSPVNPYKIDLRHENLKDSDADPAPAD